MIDGVFTLLPILPPPHGLSGIAGGDKSDERLVGHSSRLPGTLKEDNAKGINDTTLIYKSYKTLFNGISFRFYDERVSLESTLLIQLRLNKDIKFLQVLIS